MRKPDSLRAALVAAMPDLSTDPERFLVFLKGGTIVSRWSPTAPLAAEYRYTLTIGLLDFAGDPDDIFLAVVAWVRLEQPELLAPARDGAGMTFSAEILDTRAVDLSIELQLTEAVTRGGDGAVVHAAEPGAELLGLVAAAGAAVAPPPPLLETDPA